MHPARDRGAAGRDGVEIAGADATVIGRGITVGRSLGLLLTRRSENATVTLCHTGTKDLAAHTRGADIVVAAAGVPGLLTRGHGQARRGRARRGDHPGTDAGLIGDVAPPVVEVAGGWRRCPAGWAR